MTCRCRAAPLLFGATPCRSTCPVLGAFANEAQISATRAQPRVPRLYTFRSMHSVIIAALRNDVPAIRQRWEALLRLEPTSNPLANPDNLVFLIAGTVDEIIRLCSEPATGARNAGERLLTRTPCVCGNNPYLPFYQAGEQAILEALITVQAQLMEFANRYDDLGHLCAAFRTLADRDIDAFCEACDCRGRADGCPYRVESPAEAISPSSVSLVAGRRLRCALWPSAVLGSWRRTAHQVSPGGVCRSPSRRASVG
jgi:hypothetical protein